jgi:hypothetical protein
MYRRIMARCTALGVYWVVGFPRVPHVAFPDLYETHHRVILFGLSDMKNRDHDRGAGFKLPTTNHKLSHIRLVRARRQPVVVL